MPAWAKSTPARPSRKKTEWHPKPPGPTNRAIARHSEDRPRRERKPRESRAPREPRTDTNPQPSPETLAAIASVEAKIAERRAERDARRAERDKTRAAQNEPVNQKPRKQLAGKPGPRKAYSHHFKYFWPRPQSSAN